MRQQQSPPPAVLSSSPTARSPLSEMAARAVRILSSLEETQRKPTVTPPTRPTMAKQAQKQMAHSPLPPTRST